jgi:Ca2+/Na+ antiporter
MATCAAHSPCAAACNTGFLNPFTAPELCTWPQLIATVGVYGYALFQGSSLIGDGTELLMLVPKLAPVVGSIVLPILGAVPDGMMVLFSGLGPDAQEQVSVGVGALAGSTIMLLTLPWFLAMYAGRVDCDNNGPVYKKPASAGKDWKRLSPSNAWSLSRTGVKYEDDIKDAAGFMLMTLAGYLIIQAPAFQLDKFRSKANGATDEEIHRAVSTEAKGEKTYAIVGLVVCVVFFFYYLKKMWSDANSHDGKLAEKISEMQTDAIFEGKLTLRGALSKFRDCNLGTLREESDLNTALLNTQVLSEVRQMCRVLAPFFAHYDANGDNQIDFDEFRMIFKDVRENLPKEAQKQMFDSADTDNSGFISFEEFVACFMSFALDPSSDFSQVDAGPRYKINAVSMYLADGAGPEVNKGEEDEDEDGEEEEEIPEDLANLSPEEQQKQIKIRAFTKMGIGTALVLVFSDPTVDVMAEIGIRLDISPFYVSFILAPIASNATELLAAYRLASRQTRKTMTAALSTLLGAGIMNNTFCLAIFLGLVYCRDLAWEFSAETISIFVIEAMIGLAAYFKKYMITRDGILVLCCYPLALAIVWVLENKVGLD